jgi:hypothetical protein
VSQHQLEDLKRACVDLTRLGPKKNPAEAGLVRVLAFNGLDPLDAISRIRQAAMRG